MNNARNIFKKKKEIDDIFKNMIKKESPPKTEPKKSLILDTFLFKINAVKNITYIIKISLHIRKILDLHNKFI